MMRTMSDFPPIEIPETLGVIAGRGSYPWQLARSAHAQGVKRVVAFAFKSETERVIGKYADEVVWMHLGSLQALLDVIIIDDGSTDGTAALAQAFVQAHPGSFRLVSKVNGGYGSTLNTAVELASGRYFRTLDCDDWFDTNALQTLLRRLQNCTADAVYTNYRTVQENGSGKAFDVCCKFDTNRVYAVGEVQQATPDLCMEMHALTLCTKTLRAAWRPMPEHCSYTDMGYTFVGMAAAQTICFVPVVLYQYRLGRDGQSVSMASYRAHTQDYIRVARILLDVAEPLAAQPAPAGRDLLLVQRARDVAQYLIELYLRFPPDRETGLALRRYDEMLCQTYPHIAAMMTNKNTRLLRAGRYLPYRTLSAWARGKQSNGGIL